MDVTAILAVLQYTHQPTVNIHWVKLWCAEDAKQRLDLVPILAWHRDNINVSNSRLPAASTEYPTSQIYRVTDHANASSLLHVVGWGIHIGGTLAIKCQVPSLFLHVLLSTSRADNLSVGAPGQGGYYPQQPPQSYQGYDQGQYQGGYMPQQQPQTIILECAASVALNHFAIERFEGGSRAICIQVYHYSSIHIIQAAQRFHEHRSRPLDEPKRNPNAASFAVQLIYPVSTLIRWSCIRSRLWTQSSFVEVGYEIFLSEFPFIEELGTACYHAVEASMPEVPSYCLAQPMVASISEGPHSGTLACFTAVGISFERD
ncbi:hypothetical protein ARMGADRAFT_1021807 [Armillaria gallica]|uniref:Uncharacterized protein n=1 Tax=Armillaria gallica TaxID=47427 RepID=A0A2H3EA82_ARMGA|nr:hypothetical protein ARMGADRAFT_1021807 [Armillaria gallica]